MALILVILSAVIGLLFAGWLAKFISEQDAGNEKMQDIASKIHEGAMAFLKKQYSILAIFVAVVFVLVFYFINAGTAISFVTGGFLSALAGFIGMQISTKANVRTTAAARKDLNSALKIAFSSGTVMALCVVGFGLLGLSILFWIFKDPNIIIGFGFGASSIALFARVGGGIYTKAADVGADLVGKVEVGIPEDDPRNPAVIADNVGDNVGDVAGMGADLFESYVGSIIAAMILGVVMYKTANIFGNPGVMFPLLLSAMGIIASIIGYFFVRIGKNQKEVHKAFNRGLIVASILVAAGSYFLAKMMFNNLGLFWSIITGLLTGILIGWNTEYYTDTGKKHVQSIAQASGTGPATTIIQGIVVGMHSTANTLIIISAGIFLSYYTGNLLGVEGAGIYGIAIAGVAMLSTLGISLAIDAYGPVADNAGGIAEMSGLDKAVRGRTDLLDAAGNTTAAIGKGFAIGSAALTALALFSSYASAANLSIVNLINPKVIIGILLGGMLPFYFTALTMASVGKAAYAMVEEVRRQFKKIPGLLAGKPGAKADYARCVAISTEGALKEMILPGLLTILSPIVFGVLFGAEALAGLLMGALVSGVSLAVFLANSGGAWDNAKKYIEGGKHGGKGSPHHKAAVIGDTVGDPFKDTSGPSLNILIKLMTIVSLVFLPLFLKSVF
ncbi:sodium-translocating pyrophosphatase [Candidatus Woesearchaeota archaeon]|nr:sodium-translocating pyrophosphatase [Candidatus Woesearchaeota archaeon]